MYKLFSIFLIFLLSNKVYADQSPQKLEIDKPISSSVVITKPIYQNTPFNNNVLFQRIAPKKEVFLMNIKLTDAQNEIIQNFDPDTQRDGDRDIINHLPSRIDLGMNNVPVLDQGRHGTCATFSNTAAIDALLGKGDYISQLCNLQLSNYLSEFGLDFPNGWDGSNGSYVLTQLSYFGFVPKSKENLSCGGLTQYPTMKIDTGKAMSLDSFKTMRDNTFNFNKLISWKQMLDVDQRFGDPTDPNNHYDGNKILEQVKSFLTLSANKKGGPKGIITFGFLLPVEFCSAGACASHHQVDDTWAITRSMSRRITHLGGHAMIITGFDDRAAAIDNEGHLHRGLLILRNSWGEEVGDNGNYYMTYAYFKKYAIEVQRIYLNQGY